MVSRALTLEESRQLRAAAPPPRPKKRFKWRHFFFLAFLFAMAMSFGIAELADRAGKQQQAVAWIQEQGGTVRFDYEFDATGAYDVSAELPGPEFIRNQLGIHYLSSATYVDLSNMPVSTLTPLSNLKTLNYLNLSKTNVSDLRPLNELTNLTHLDLSETGVSDFTPLKFLTSLRHLKVIGNRNLPSYVLTEVEKQLAGLLPEGCEIVSIESDSSWDTE